MIIQYPRVTELGLGWHFSSNVRSVKHYNRGREREREREKEPLVVKNLTTKDGLSFLSVLSLLVTSEIVK